MIITENITLHNKQFKKTYSDEGYYIQKFGENDLYSEAIDLPTVNFEYVETDKKIGEAIEGK